MFRVSNAYPDRSGSRYIHHLLVCNLTNLLFNMQVIKLDIIMGKDHGGERDNAGSKRKHVTDVADVISVGCHGIITTNCFHGQMIVFVG